MTALILIAILALVGVVISFIQNDLAISAFELAFNTDVVDSVAKILHLTNSAFDDDLLTGFYGVVNAAFTAIKPLGFALITTFFIFRIIDMASSDGLSFETLVRSLIQLVLVFTVAGNSTTIINAILSLGEAALTSVYNGVYSQLVTGTDVSDLAVEFAQTSAAVIMALELVAIVVIHFVVLVGVDVAAISRLIDIGWRAAFMPVGIANCFSGGMNSPGIQYVKGFIGAVLSGAAMLVIVVIGMSLSAEIIVAAGTFPSSVTRTFMACAAQLATVGAATGISARMREIIG